MDSLAHDEPTQRAEPGAPPARDEPLPSRPSRPGTLVAPPPPGLVALPSSGDTDAPWRRPDDPPPPRRTAPDAATTPPPATHDSHDGAVGRAAGPDGTTSPADPDAAEPDAAVPQDLVVEAPAPVAVPGPAAEPERAGEEVAPPRADGVVDADQTGEPEPAYPSERENPAWLGEPTGHFDLDLPEPGGRNPSWLGEPTRAADPDEPFDQYALLDEPPAAGAVERPATAPGQLRGARDAVTVDLAEHDGEDGDLPDPQRTAVMPRAAAASAYAALGQPGAQRPTVAGPPHAHPGLSTPTEAFTMPVQEVPRESWIDPRLHGGRRRLEAAPARKRARRPRSPRRAGIAMPLLILFGLVAAFFSWVSAEPLWLAVGHGKTGTLTVTSCTGSGLLQRCVGEFATPARDFTAESVSVLGPPGQAEGLSAPARMVGAGSHRAYVTNGTGGLHLRWMIGLSIVMFCSICIVFATGALRLPERRERLAAIGLAFAGPLLITIGFLAATF
ncbi:hypothetical protein Cme02nite_68370 [Catellatospora methionotrophica]|uniref:Uncharacterized protein n=1 Tax=Catellatospora methionotrophica TaxID=121620 RepID=A0A8J3LPQ5_9ACTN|nr:hypothetical protein [Catellatospora methionotrophica]GIG18505.1 hypothetical protein Cme02nite_68370 [Catellatospora methionotrophica]